MCLGTGQISTLHTPTGTLWIPAMWSATKVLSQEAFLHQDDLTPSRSQRNCSKTQSWLSNATEWDWKLSARIEYQLEHVLRLNWLKGVRNHQRKKKDLQVLSSWRSLWQKEAWSGAVILEQWLKTLLLRQEFHEWSVCYSERTRVSLRDIFFFFLKPVCK